MSLSEPLPELLLERMTAAARVASEHAYCPYSGFPVGAAVLTEDGAIFAGCNVENAAYGLSMCAERNAVFQAVSHGKTRLRAVLIFTPTPEPTMPCGACRQVIHELGANAEVVSTCIGTTVLRTRLDRLLAQAFGPEDLDASRAAVRDSRQDI